MPHKRIPLSGYPIRTGERAEGERAEGERAEGTDGGERAEGERMEGGRAEGERAGGEGKWAEENHPVLNTSGAYVTLFQLTTPRTSILACVG